MADEENAPISRKRVAGSQINKDSPEADDDTSEQEMGTFQRASEEVMATRRIVKVRRHQQPSAPSSNPFSAIRFTPSDSSVETSGPVTELQPCGIITAPKVQEVTCLNEKADEGNNGSGKDALSETDKKAGSNETSEVLKDESVLKGKSDDTSGKLNQPVETSEKAEDGGDESVNEAKEVGRETKEDAGKTAEVESEIRGGEAEEKTISDKNEAGDEDHVSKDDTGGTAGDESATKNGASEEKNDADQKGQPSSSTSLFSFQKLSSNQEGKTSTPLSFQQLSSGQNAFTGLAGTGFSSSPFSFGANSGPHFGLTDSSSSSPFSFGANSGPLFGRRTDSSSLPSFGSGAANNGSSSSPALATSAEAPKKLAMQEVPLETGEENEKAVFTADAALYEYLEGGWKERGKGELKLNISVSSDERARLVMRAKGNYRLILNASLYADMSLKDMDKKGMTFACVNSVGEAQSGLTTFALKFKDTSIREEFSAAVAMHKVKKDPDVLKTPENSPKASDD